MKRIAQNILMAVAFSVQCMGCEVSMQNTQKEVVHINHDSINDIRFKELHLFIDSTDLKLSEKPDSLFNLLYTLHYGVRPKSMAHIAIPEKSDSSKILNKIESFFTADNPNYLADIQDLEPKATQYQQLKVHYQRLLRESKSDSLAIIHESLNAFRWIQRFTDSSFAIVNIPSTELFVNNQEGSEVLRMRVIVGSKTHQTPAFATYTPEIITYPYWNVPRSIAVNEILPKVKRNVGYLARNNMQVIGSNGRALNPAQINWSSYGASNFPYRFRQSTGCDNALGVVKFNLESPYAIYMHDTNARGLFERSYRWLSHGCIRLQNPTELANLILNEPIFDQEYLNQCLIGAKPGSIRLAKPFPVFILYLQADINAKGELRWNNDVYNWAKF